MKNGKNILVTGGLGFIGSNFIIDQLLNKHNTILNVDKLTYAGSLDTLVSIENHKQYSLIRGDICDSIIVKKCIKQFQPDYIVNFAAESHVDRSIDDPQTFIHTNILGVSNLLMNTHQYFQSLNRLEKSNFRFLHISTDEVYGSLLFDDSQFTESTKYDPSSPYSASKAASDHLVRAWNKTYNLPILITNSSNNYGPNQFPEKLIPLMILRCIAEKELPIYGKGKNVRDWIFVNDHCEAIYQVLTKSEIGETYNIGANNEIKNIDIVHKICAIMNKKLPRKNGLKYESLIKFVKDRPGHDLRYAIDNHKIKEHIGWKPSISFDDGLDITIQWYLDNAEWWENKIKKNYNLSRLGLNK